MGGGEGRLNKRTQLSLMWLINEGDTRAQLCGFQPGGWAGRWQWEAPPPRIPLRPTLATPRSGTGEFSKRTSRFVSLCPDGVMLLSASLECNQLGFESHLGHQSSWIEATKSVGIAIRWKSYDT